MRTKQQNPRKKKDNNMYIIWGRWGIWNFGQVVERERGADLKIGFVKRKPIPVEIQSGESMWLTCIRARLCRPPWDRDRLYAGTRIYNVRENVYFVTNSGRNDVEQRAGQYNARAREDDDISSRAVYTKIMNYASRNFDRWPKTRYLKIFDQPNRYIIHIYTYFWTMNTVRT